MRVVEMLSQNTKFHGGSVYNERCDLIGAEVMKRISSVSWSRLIKSIEVQS
jgi:hypothetical protein